MKKIYTLLPCNGVEQILGQLSSVIVDYIITKKSDLLAKNDIVIKKKPSLTQVAAGEPLLEDNKKDDDEGNGGAGKIVALNGCAFLCVNKILNDRGIKPDIIISLPKIVKKIGLPKGVKSILDLHDLPYLDSLSAELLNELGIGKEKTAKSEKAVSILDYFEFRPEFGEILEFTHGKFKFKVPVAAEPDKFFFNWNDAWAYILSGKEIGIESDALFAVVGISDYMQQNLSDILMVELPEVGAKIDQFEAIGTLESTKSVAEVLTPFTGEVVAVNRALEEEPERINMDPYGKGWIAIIKLSNFEDEKENVQSPAEYFEEMKQKILEEGGN